MPTVFSHAAVGLALGRWLSWPRLSSRFWICTGVCAMLPDLDVIGLAFGVPYESVFGHRGLTHSIVFAGCVAVPLAHLFSTSGAQGGTPGRLVLWLWFAAITASHGVLDAFTDGGRGIAFLAPFSDRRFFFPWRPIRVSPIGARFFSARGLEVLTSEILWILAPAALIAVLGGAFVRRRRMATGASVRTSLKL